MITDDRQPWMIRLLCVIYSNYVFISRRQDFGKDKKQYIYIYRIYTTKLAGHMSSTFYCQMANTNYIIIYVIKLYMYH